MDKKTAAVIGATGLIGSHIVTALKTADDFETIRLVVRMPVTDTDPKIEMKLVNFGDYESLKLAIDGCDVVFCAVGTTLKKVKGDKIAYRKADYDIPVAAARACLETKCDRFLVISSVGANASASNFYLQLKGEMEGAIQKFPLPSISIFRPSMLLGDRKEFRWAEKIGGGLMKLASPILPARYKPIEASEVATALVEASRKNKRGVTIYEYTGMKELIG